MLAPRIAMIDDARRGGDADGAGASDPALSAASAMPSATPPTGGSVRAGGRGTPTGARAGAAVGGVGGAAAGTPDTPNEVIEVCPCADCEVGLPGGVGSRMGLTHLHQRHLLRDVPAATAAEHQLAGCRWCHRPFRSVRGRTGRSSLTAHEAQCAGNPRKRFAREAAAAAVRRGTAAAAAEGSSAAGGAVRGGPTAASAVRGAAAAAATGPTNGVVASAPAGGGPGGQGGEADRLFSSSFSAWTRRREDFLRRVAPTPDDWAPLVASGARTAAHVPSALGGAWSALMADALEWVGREPGQRHAWLWLLLLPSLLLHVPVADRAGDSPPPSAGCRTRGGRPRCWAATLSPPSRTAMRGCGGRRRAAPLQPPSGGGGAHPRPPSACPPPSGARCGKWRRAG